MKNGLKKLCRLSAGLAVWALLSSIAASACLAAEPRDGVLALALDDQELSFIDFSTAELQVLLCPESLPGTMPPELRRTIIWDPDGGDGKRDSLLMAMVVLEAQDDGRRVSGGLEPLQFCAASRDPIVLPCGEFHMTAALAPEANQLEAEIEFYLDSADAGGVFSGDLELNLQLRFENSDLSRVVYTEHVLPLLLHGPWRFAAADASDPVATDLDCDGWAGGYEAASDIELGAAPDDEAPLGFCSAGVAGAGWLCWQPPL